MPATGYIQVNAYASYARLPLRDVAITITANDGTVPVEVPVPEASDSQVPNPPERPFATVNLYAHLRGYEQVEAENLQVFANTVTQQDLMMIPLSELPDSWDQTAIYTTPPQNL